MDQKEVNKLSLQTNSRSFVHMYDESLFIPIANVHM